MARPSRISITPAITGWDTSVNDMFASIYDQPFPVRVVADLATLTSTYSAALYDQCLAATSDTSTLYISNGTTWNAV